MLSQILMSLKVMLIGLGTVFTALVLLILVIEALNIAINGRKSNVKKEATYGEKAFERVEKLEENRIAQDRNADADVTQDEEEIIAVISAAVAAALNRSTHDIVVRSVRRIPTHSPAWNRVGREEQIATRL